MFDAMNMLGAADPRHGRMALPEQAKTMFQDGVPMIVVAAGVGADALALLGKRVTLTKWCFLHAIYEAHRGPEPGRKLR